MFMDNRIVGSRYVACISLSKTHNSVCMTVCTPLKVLPLFGLLDIADFLTDGDKFKTEYPYKFKTA